MQLQPSRFDQQVGAGAQPHQRCERGARLGLEGARVPRAPAVAGLHTAAEPPPPTRHHRQGLFEWESHEEVLDTRRVGEIGSVLNAVKPKYAVFVPQGMRP